MSLVVVTSTPRRRVMIFGFPNTGKTRSLLTFPEPRVIISSPGEKGHETLQGAPGTHAYRWEAGEEEGNSHQVLNDLVKESISLIAKHEPRTFAFEGLHKIIGHIMNSATDGAWFKGKEFDAKLYSAGYRMFDQFLDRLSETQVPVTVFTCWADHDNERKAKPGEKSSDVPRVIRPDLPGKLAAQVEGEFGMSFHQTIGRLPGVQPTTPTIGLWQTKPSQDIRGCAIKGPKEIVDKIEPKVEANWGKLELALQKATMEAKG